MLLDRKTHKFFDDLINYLFTMISVTLTFELYISGKAGIYKEKHGVSLTAKQLNKDLYFYPANCLNQFFRNAQWPNQLEFEEKLIDPVPPYQTLPLSIFEKPSFSFLISMFINFYETYKLNIEKKFSEDTTNWPDVWNFGRVVRNSLSHGSRINFLNPNASPVSWQSLTYMPKDNGKLIFHTDLWPGDIIYLMFDMNSDL